MSENIFRLYAPDEAGSDGYPMEWHRSIKHAVREQAGFRCVRCHHPYRNGEHGKGEWSPCDESCMHYGPFRVRPPGTEPTGRIYPGVPLPTMFELGVVEAHWRILTVHHVSMCKLDCRWPNLIALCQRCHLHVQSKVRLERTWPWEHSEWFKVYVAAFYAREYLGLELTRSEVEARLPELLALERVGA